MDLSGLLFSVPVREGLNFSKKTIFKLVDSVIASFYASTSTFPITVGGSSDFPPSQTSFEQVLFL